MMMGEHLGLLFLMRAGQQRKADIHHRLTSVVLRGFFLGGYAPPPSSLPSFRSQYAELQPAISHTPGLI